MPIFNKILVATILCCWAVVPARTSFAKPTKSPEEERIQWARAKLEGSLAATGVTAGIEVRHGAEAEGLPENVRRPEGFRIRVADRKINVGGFDEAGAMYGCLELARRIGESGGLPAGLDFSDAPSMSLRGTCILLMKLGTYNYPITPSEFPFFYDRKMWVEYLDYLAENRFNYIAFWNGHPFDYFVRLERFPEAQNGMPAGLLEKNHELLTWLSREAQRRNIWLMFQFYNIHTSVYFQKAHDLPEENTTPTPLLADYTGYCIEKFVGEFPGVGLYICPGEALELKYTSDWINDVILAAVKRTGKTPPVMVRSWGIDFEHMKQVMGKYPRLYSERKFNVEMIASTEVDPANADWARLTGNHVVNIHCMANLEPFRWTPPSYIQKCVTNSVAAGATGLHLYPRKAWRWPFGSDAGPSEPQWKRDTLWFEMWGRYAWNPRLDANLERQFWIDRLTRKYGNPEAAGRMLESFEQGADVLPAIQRLIWLGADNHTVVTAGIKLAQLETAKGIPFLALPGLVRIPEYLDSISKGAPVAGTSPVEFMRTKLSEARIAAEKARAAAGAATRNVEDARRIASDAEAVALVGQFYLSKLEAAAAKRHCESGKERARDCSEFVTALHSSLETFRKLTNLTQNTYESLSDVPATHPERLKKCPYHWSDILPLLEREYEIINRELLAPEASDPELSKPTRSGLAGIWYGNPGLEGPQGEARVTSLEMDWSSSIAEKGNNWSAEWFGTLIAPASGKITFHVESDQGATISLNGRTVLDWSGTKGAKEGSVELTHGLAYPIHIIYNHRGGRERYLRIRWSWRGGERTAIDAEYLRHSEKDSRRMERVFILR